LGGWRIDHGRLSQGQLIALINYLTQILQALIVVANLVMLYARAWNSAGRTEEILGMTVAASEVEGDFTTSENTTENSQQNSVAFAGVDFSYPRSTGGFIEQLSFKLEPGSVNGLIGPAGSGKSTIARLLVRLYEPVLGRIMLGDRAVDEFSAAELSSLIGYVPQNPSLMTGTIEENLRMGRDAFSEDDLWHALRLAQADGFVRELNDGLNSQVTRGGRNFSGGQRQRLAIARAILGRPRVIILDDSTSALDYATDLALRRALMSDEFLKSSTWIIISQRIANIRDADNILLLDDGALLASGTHEELMSGSDMYRELFHSQLDTRQHEEEADND
jgi:ATP-binding cassette subfamily B protein